MQTNKLAAQLFRLMLFNSETCLELRNVNAMQNFVQRICEQQNLISRKFD